MSQLQQHLRQIVTQFVSSILDVVSDASLADFVDGAGAGRAKNGASVQRSAGRPAVRPAAGGRRHRATADEVRRQKEVALSAAKALGPGFRKGDVMKRSKSSVDLGRALSLLVKEGKLSKKGDRRKARYWVS